MKYEIKPIISIINVSEIGEWVNNLNFLKRTALKKPKNIPRLRDFKAKIKKSVIIVPGELQVKGFAGLPSDGNCYWTTPNKIILTISLKTPSP